MPQRKYKIKRVAPGLYDVLANDGPRTRYSKVAEVAKDGTKWLLGGESFRTKKEAYEQAIIDREASLWPSDAAFQEGQELRHNEIGSTGRCVGVCVRGGQYPYTVKVADKSFINGRAEAFSEVQ